MEKDLQQDVSHVHKNTASIAVLAGDNVWARAARLLHMDAPNRIPGAYNVIFKTADELTVMPLAESARAAVQPNLKPLTRADAESLSNGLVDSIGGEKTHLFFGKAVTGFAIRGLKDNQIPDVLLSDPRIDYIEPDLLLTLLSSPQTSAPWHLDRIDQRNLPGDGLYNYTTTAPDVDVYIFDSGVTVWHNEFTYTSGGQLNTRVLQNSSGLPGVTYCLNTNHTCADYNVAIGYPLFPLGNPDSGDPCNGHGTKMAGIVGGATYGVAKSVRLHAVRIADCQGNINNSDLVSGLQNALSELPRLFPSGALQHSTVFNLSLGSQSISTMMDSEVNAAVNAGVVVVAAAGNDNQDACNGSPGHLSTTSSVITVGGSQPDDQAWFVSTFEGGTNYGPCVSLFAPASQVVAASNSSLSATSVNDPPKAGTSDSTAVVSGITALYLQTHYGASPASVKAALLQNATPNKLSGTGFGTGSPNLLAYSLLSVGNQPPPTGPTQQQTVAAFMSEVLLNVLLRSH